MDDFDSLLDLFNSNPEILHGAVPQPQQQQQRLEHQPGLMMPNARMQPPMVPGGMMPAAAMPSPMASHGILGLGTGAAGMLGGGMSAMPQQPQQQQLPQQPGTLSLGALHASSGAASGGMLSGAFDAGLGGLGLGAGLGGLGAPMEPYVGLQAAGGMRLTPAAGGATMLPGRASITTAAGLGMGAATVAPQPGLATSAPGGGVYGMGAGMNVMAATMAATGLTAGAIPVALAAATGSAGGKAGSRRGRSAGAAAAQPRVYRRSEADPGSSDPDLDSNSDSASSDGDMPAHKSNKKKREGGTVEDVAERKHAALQEKNRKAQRRFRERQKTKLMELNKQIEELASKVSNLQTENAALHSRTSILEKVLDMRNEQIQVMQENKEVSEAELASPIGTGQALVSLTPETIKDLASEGMYRVYQTYVKELSVRLVHLKGMDAGAAAVGGEGGSEAGGGGAGGAAGEVRSGGGAAGSGEAAVAAAAQADVERLVRELSVMLMRLGVARPLEARKFIVFSRQYLGNTEKEVIELWKNVMKNIDLTPEQMREIVELKRMFLAKIEPIMEERKHLNISIQTNLPHDTFHTKSSISYIKAHEAVSKLRDNLRSEQHVVLEFAVAVFSKVFKPTQMATLLVKCYPAVPDALGIASALATELGEPDSLATQQLAMQLGGYSIPSAQGQSGASAGGLLSIHPSLMPIDANVEVAQQLMQQQQAAAQHLLQQQQQLITQQQQEQQQQMLRPMMMQPQVPLPAQQQQQGGLMGQRQAGQQGGLMGQQQAGQQCGQMQPQPQQPMMQQAAMQQAAMQAMHMNMQQQLLQPPQQQFQAQQQLQLMQQQASTGMYGVPSPNADFTGMGLMGEGAARSGSISSSSAATPTGGQ